MLAVDGCWRKPRLIAGSFRLAIVTAMVAIVTLQVSTAESAALKTGSVIFIHPDGTGLGSWTALRLIDRGPDGMTNWDRMEAMGIYRGYLRDSPVSSSNGGGTVHAYGVKADYAHYGNNDQAPLRSLSGESYSIMTEAAKRGKSVGIINSGHIAEPGTGVFVASVPQRYMVDEISEQIVRSGADVIMAGGEKYLLPEGTQGRHGPGARKDGKDIIKVALELGYTIVYTHDELMKVDSRVDKLLGVFATSHTFNDRPEETLKQESLPLYNADAPSVAEMTEVALRVLANKGRDFLLVVEEEGTDNFGNSNNASGMLEAIRRADAAIGKSLDYVEKNPRTLLLTAADSDAGGMQVVWWMNNGLDESTPLPERTRNGAPVDGPEGTASLPFMTAPDRNGRRLPFAITWAGLEDLDGDVVARAHGLNSELLPRNVDNTDIYRMMYATLFGRWLETTRP